MSKNNVKKIFSNCLSFVPKSQRYKLLRHMIKIPEPPADVSFEVAKTDQDLDAAFSLLYDAYLEEKLTTPLPSKRRETIYHALETTSTLIAKRNNNVIATVSIIKDGLLGLPAQNLIDLQQFKVPGKNLAEVSSLALRNNLQGQSPKVMFYLSKYLFKFSREYLGIDRFIIAFHPKQVPLYEGLFLFTLLQESEAKAHGFANNAPAVCATNNLETVEDHFKQVYGSAPENRDLYRFFFKTFSAREKAIMKFPDQSWQNLSEQELFKKKKSHTVFDIFGCKQQAIPQ